MRRRLNNAFQGQWDVAAIAATVLLVLSILFGGASRDHALRLALVELASLPLLVLGATRLAQTGAWRQHRFALALAAILAAIPLAQIIPLPPSIWTRLPGRDQMVLALDLVGQSPGWTPLSLAPELTWTSALALLPPLAMFLGALSASEGVRGRLIRLCILAAVISVSLGAVQLVSGSDRFYPWATTDAGSVNGFFANRNHLASFLLVTLPFAVVLGAGSLRRRNPAPLSLWLAALFVALVVVGLAAIRSRAGIILLVPSLTISFLAVWIASGRGRPSRALLIMFGATGAALTAVVALALPALLARFGENADGRIDRWPTVATAAETYLPFGSGIGSFDVVYRSVEPLAELDSTFFNQAHNEYLETWLEAGWFGVGLIVAFCVWYARRTWNAWKAPPSRNSDLGRAASIGVGVLLLHSIADYPLRTATLAVLLALCCALLELAHGSERSLRDPDAVA